MVSDYIIRAIRKAVQQIQKGGPVEEQVEEDGTHTIRRQGRGAFFRQPDGTLAEISIGDGTDTINVEIDNAD